MMIHITGGESIDIPQSRILRIYAISAVNNGTVNEVVTLEDSGNYYNGTDFSQTFTKPIFYTFVVSGRAVYRQLNTPIDVQNKLTVNAPNTIEVVIDAEYL